MHSFNISNYFSAILIMIFISIKAVVGDDTDTINTDTGILNDIYILN